MIVAVAHSILCISYHILFDRKPYSISDMFVGPVKGSFSSSSGPSDLEEEGGKLSGYLMA
jgi:hypothetical protein